MIALQPLHMFPAHMHLDSREGLATHVTVAARAKGYASTHREIFSTLNQIVFAIFRLIWIQTDVRLDPNQSENDKIKR